jgi:hypothetical protein
MHVPVGVTVYRVCLVAGNCTNKPVLGGTTDFSNFALHRLFATSRKRCSLLIKIVSGVK